MSASFLTSWFKSIRQDSPNESFPKKVKRIWEGLETKESIVRKEELSFFLKKNIGVEAFSNSKEKGFHNNICKFILFKNQSLKYGQKIMCTFSTQ